MPSDPMPLSLALLQLIAQSVVEARFALLCSSSGSEKYSVSVSWSGAFSLLQS